MQEEAIMTKRIKKIAGLLSLAVFCLIAPVAQVKADTTTASNGAYTVTIPAEVSVDSKTGKGNLNISAVLDPYNELDISVTSQNSYQLECGTQSLNYTLTGTGFTDNKITYDTTNVTNDSKTNFSTTLAAQVNGQATISGTYNDILTFTMDCRESYPDGKCRLVYDANGGTVTTTGKVLNIGSVYGTLETPTRIGYSFEGWYTGLNGGQKVSEQDKILQGTTIYAHWKANTYTIQYNNNNGSNHSSASGAMENTSMTYDKKQKLSKCTFTNNDSGAHFVGWSTEADGSGTRYQDEEEVLNLISEENGNIVLYAQWEYENKVMVRFEDVNGNMDNATRTVIDKTLPAGEAIAWSIEELDEWKENSKQWEHQWQTPTDKGAVNYTTTNASKETIIDIKRQLYYLDLNAQWYDSNGKSQSGGGNLKWNNIVTAKVKVEVNGVVQEAYTEATDYFIEQRYGSTFKFTVTMESGYEFKGVTVGSEQPLSKVQVNGNVVTGIVTGERYIDNSGNRGPYRATTVALNIQKVASDETKEQTVDTEKENSDSQKAIQKIAETEEVPQNEEASDEESISEAETQASEAETQMASEMENSTETPTESETIPETEVPTEVQTEAVQETEVLTEAAPQSEPEEISESASEEKAVAEEAVPESVSGEVTISEKQ